MDFNIANGPIELTSGLSLQFDGTDKDLIICNLNIKRKSEGAADNGLLFISHLGGQHIVQLYNANISNVRNGIETTGTGNIEIANSTITGDTSKSGACLSIKSPGAIVKSSDISGCGEGVRIEADGAFLGAESADKFDAEANRIHDNKVGIHWVSGDANRFPFNIVTNNAQDSSKITPDDAILINETMTVPRPEVKFDEATGKALNCTKGSDGKYMSWINLDNVEKDQEVILYNSDYKYQQATSYLSKCTEDSDGRCIISTPSAFTTQCGDENIYAVALINNGDYTTMLTSRAFILSERPSSSPALPVDVLSGTGHTGMDGAVEISDTNAGATTVTSGGDLGTPAAGAAKMGCGSSLLGAPDYSQGLWWALWLAIPAIARRGKRPSSERP